VVDYLIRHLKEGEFVKSVINGVLKIKKISEKGKIYKGRKILI